MIANKGMNIPSYKASLYKLDSLEFINPEFVYIPLSIKGDDFDVLVNEGDNVKLGQIIARRKEGKGLPLTKHATVSGEVIGLVRKTHRTGLPYQSIKIKNDFKDTPANTLIAHKDHTSLSREDIVKTMIDGGIVGLGGSGFPTAIKYGNVAEVDTVILNGTECEPYLTSDYRLMMEKTDQLVKGLQLLMKTAGAKRGIIAIKKGYKDLLKTLVSAITEDDSISVATVPNIYPAGWEKAVVYRTTGRSFDRLPLECGVIVNNVSTAVSVYEAVVEGKPVIERYVTVAGSAILKPATVRVRVGTLMSDLIEQYGHLADDLGDVRLITGGPMMGKSHKNSDVVISRGVNGVLALPSIEQFHLDNTKPAGEIVLELLHFVEHDKNHIVKDEQPCVRCSKCVEACPAHLQPIFLNRFSQVKNADMLKKLDVSKCIECGSCSYVCPSHIELTESISKGKRFVASRK